MWKCLHLKPLIYLSFVIYIWRRKKKTFPERSIFESQPNAYKKHYSKYIYLLRHCTFHYMAWYVYQVIHHSITNHQSLCGKFNSNWTTTKKRKQHKNKAESIVYIYERKTLCMCFVTFVVSTFFAVEIFRFEIEDNEREMNGKKFDGSC